MIKYMYSIFAAFLFSDSKHTSDSDVDGVTFLSVYSLAPVLSTVCWVNSFDSTDRRCRRLPVTEAHADFSLFVPHNSPSSCGVKTLAVKSDGAIIKELQSGWNNPSCI